MKLAEALVLRADLQKRIAQLKQRILNNALVQEGDEPSEAPSTLLEEIELLLKQSEELAGRINHTNCETRLNSGDTLTAALAHRDTLRFQSQLYRDLAEAASNKRSRYSNSEIKYVSTVMVPQVQGQADDLAKKHRLLDTEIQQLNWNTDLKD